MSRISLRLKDPCHAECPLCSGGRNTRGADVVNRRRAKDAHRRTPLNDSQESTAVTVPVGLQPLRYCRSPRYQFGLRSDLPRRAAGAERGLRQGITTLVERSVADELYRQIEILRKSRATRQSTAYVFRAAYVNAQQNVWACAKALDDLIWLLWDFRHKADTLGGAMSAKRRIEQPHHVLGRKLVIENVSHQAQGLCHVDSD